VAEAARRLGCSTSVVYHWIHTGQLTARRSSGSRLCIPVGRPHPGRLPPADRRILSPEPRCPPAHAARPAISRRRRRDQRHRSRLPARLQHSCHLLLDRHRKARRPPRPGRPAAHSLERPGSGRMPRPDRAIRPPQPGSPQDQAPPAALSIPRCRCPLAH
jgi:excisionase family DNA binding protein